MNNLIIIRSKLIELARSKTIWTYEVLNKELNLYNTIANHKNGRLIGEDLSRVSLLENQKNRPLLSSLIIKHSTDKPGDGFYKCCGLIFTKDWEELKRDKNFRELKQQDCFDFWKIEENYQKFKNDYY
jgi:hypothetical protein